MAYKVFADTNVYLDCLLQRGKEWQSAEALFELAEKNEIEVYTSASSVINIIYVMSSCKVPKQEIIAASHVILSYSKLINPGNQVFQTALLSGFDGLEDAVQYHTALQEKGMDHFITANTKDFKKALAQLPVLTAHQFIQQL
jgi:predicted nucleic acid-binding protein